MKILVMDSSEAGRAVAGRLALAGYEVEWCDPKTLSSADLATDNRGVTGIGEARNPLSAELMLFEALSRHRENLVTASERHLDSGTNHRPVRQLPGAEGAWQKRVNGAWQGSGDDRRIRRRGSGR